MGVFSFEAYRSLGLPRAELYAAIAVVLLVGFLIVSRFLFGRSMARSVFILAFLMALLRMGFAVPDSIAPGEYRLTGYVASVSETNAHTVTVSSAALDGTRIKYKLRLSVKDRDSVPPKVGDEISAYCTVGEGYSGYASSRLTLLASGISLKAGCDGFTVVSEHNLPLAEWTDGVRKALKNRIAELFPDNAPIVTAFLLGDRSGLDYEQMESFRSTGTAHILSLSGLHVGILVAVLLFVIPKGYPKLRFGAICLFLLLFCLIAGFAPSLVRASVMSVCILLADLAEQRRDPLSSISLAALLILAVSPYSLWSAGFRLSFAATLGIILFADQAAFSTRSRTLDRVISAALVTFSATAATLLISARYFGYIDTYTVPINLVAIPVYSTAIVLSFAALLIGIPLPFAAKYVSWIPDKLIGGANAALSWASELPYAKIAVSPPLEICGLLMIVLMFIVSPYVLRPIKSRLIMAAPVFLMLAAGIVFSVV